MRFLPFAAAAMLLAAGCSGNAGKIDVIFDSDANNELDDQHAIAYMLMNDETFNVLGITTNVTNNGGNIEEQSEEARRVIGLVGKYGENATVIPGATGSFEEIRPNLDASSFDGDAAVNFIIEKARKYKPSDKLVLIAVGKLTNVALALEKAPEIAANIRLVWLGSNYPESGEYNLVNDIPSMNYVLDTEVEFEFVTVRYGKPSGTDAVRVSIDRVKEEFAGKGPKVSKPVTGRNGGEFTCFGDYSLNLFENISLGEGGTRALFDMAAVAVVKNGDWARKEVIPAPTMVDGQWVDRPDNSRKVTLWVDFDGEAIISDFLKTLNK